MPWQPIEKVVCGCGDGRRSYPTAPYSRARLSDEPFVSIALKPCLAEAAPGESP